MAIGAIIGFVAGLVLIPAYCVLHLVALAWWEHYRMVAEKRKTVRAASKILVDKMRDVELQATREVFAEMARERIKNG